MSMVFDPTSGLRDSVTYPTVPASESDAREQIQGRMDEVKFYLNKHGVTISDTGPSADTMAVTLSTPTISDNDVLVFINPKYTNLTSAVTLNVNGLGAVNVYRNSTVPLLPGDIKANSKAIIAYSTETSAYELLNPTFINTTGASAHQVLGVSASTVPEWKASIQSVMTAEGDIIYASGSNTPTKLAKGLQYQNLLMNATTTAPEWGASLQSLMTAEGDIVYASTVNTPSKLAKGTAYEHLGMNATTEVPEWQESAKSVLTAPGDVLYADGANSLQKLAIGSAGEILKVNATTDAPEWGTVGSFESGVFNFTTTVTGLTALTKTVSLASTEYNGIRVFFYDTNGSAIGEFGRSSEDANISWGQSTGGYTRYWAFGGTTLVPATDPDNVITNSTSFSFDGAYLSGTTFVMQFYNYSSTYESIGIYGLYRTF